MSARPRKHSRAVADENRADCPYTITVVATPSRDDHAPKKRRRDVSDEDRKDLVQPSPFDPRGKFKTHPKLDLAYNVEPRRKWLDMTRYNSFVLNNVKYYSEDYVYVTNDATIERQKASNKDRDRRIAPQSRDYWVAKILEVRASDEHHVYARVYWMYSPDELPPSTLHGRKVVSGRQPYHGQNELIASNHMDVINVVSVAMHAVVNHWVESEDEQVQDALYWRQAFDCRTSQLSSVELTCRCKTPANPDKMLIGCTNSDCGEWLHYECLRDDVLMHVYQQLGTDKSRKSRRSDDHSTKVDTNTKPATLRSTPADIKGEELQSTIGVKEAESGDSDLAAKRIDGITPKTTESPIPGTFNLGADTVPKTSSAKKGRMRKTVDSKPYDGLFEATLKLDDGPTRWIVSDLRTQLSGGDRSWSQRALCLVCGAEID